VSNNADALPHAQYAVQLVGPGKLALNREKPLLRPGPHQILVRVEAVGLCFSDLKLLKQFHDHPRKSEVLTGIDRAVLDALPSYVPGDKPTVPGHEVVGCVAAVGEGVRRHRVGERVLVQADWRFLRTAGSNGAFGYNFEGGLQEYVLFDERIVIDPETGERYLLPVDRELGAAQVCLVEPWGCVENSYANRERRTIAAGGRLLVVIADGRKAGGVEQAYSPEGPPAEAVTLEGGAPEALAERVGELANEAFDDIVYFGAAKAVLDALNDKPAAGGILNVVTGGQKIGEPVSVGVGRVHYGPTRWIGTTGESAAHAYATISETGELRDGDSVLIVGAGGPMGQMHTIRAVCSGMKDITVTATDLDDARLDALAKKAGPLAEARGAELRLVNTKTQPLEGRFSYFALMAPLGSLVADAIERSLPGARINIFAGIPAPTRQDLDLDKYIANGCFMFGTSGSRIEDMRIVLEKVSTGQFDTSRSVDAVSGMGGAIDGIAAVENRTMAGKIIVYPELHEMPLIALHELASRYPSVADKLDAHGMWTRDAEQELLRVAR